jgi:hypothetical protein
MISCVFPGEIRVKKNKYERFQGLEIEKALALSLLYCPHYCRQSWRLNCVPCVFSNQSPRFVRFFQTGRGTSIGFGSGLQQQRGMALTRQRRLSAVKQDHATQGR